MWGSVALFKYHVDCTWKSMLMHNIVPFCVPSGDIIFGKLVDQIVHLEQKILDAASHPCIWNYLAFWGTILLSTLIHDGLCWFSWISDQENKTILCDQNRIAKKPTILFQIHQTTIIQLPPFAVNTWVFGIKYVPLYVLHILVSPPQHTLMGKEILEVYGAHHRSWRRPPHTPQLPTSPPEPRR